MHMSLPGLIAFAFLQGSPAAEQSIPYREKGAASTAAEAALDIQRNEVALRLDSTFFSPVRIYRDGGPLEIGAFAGDAGQFFDRQSAAARHLADYRQKKIVGVALWSTGMAALVTDIALSVLAGGSSPTVHISTATLWGLLGGGAATALAGVLVINHANASLDRAVQAHNADLFDKYLSAAATRL